MKKILLIVSLVMVALAACSKREEVPGAPTNPLPEATAISVEAGNYRMYKHCVDGVLYLTFGNKSITMQRDIHDKPVACVQPAEPGVR